MGQSSCQRLCWPPSCEAAELARLCRVDLGYRPPPLVISIRTFAFQIRFNSCFTRLHRSIHPHIAPSLMSQPQLQGLHWCREAACRL